MIDLRLRDRPRLAGWTDADAATAIVGPVVTQADGTAVEPSSVPQSLTPFARGLQPNTPEVRRVHRPVMHPAPPMRKPPPPFRLEAPNRVRRGSKVTKAEVALLGVADSSEKSHNWTPFRETSRRRRASIGIVPTSGQSRRALGDEESVGANKPARRHQMLKKQASFTDRHQSTKEQLQRLSIQAATGTATIEADEMPPVVPP